ncbi:MAG: hypothetical protein ACYTF7_10220 [Planctomycetota bacterium]|jgi:hypothetical protein
MLARLVAATIAVTTLTPAAPARSPVAGLEADSLAVGPMLRLSFLVGDYTIADKSLDADGNTVAEDDTGLISVRPGLNGNYLFLIGSSSDPTDTGKQLWMLTWHAGNGQFVATVFEDDEPDSGKLSGTFDQESRTLSLTSDPFDFGEGQTFQFRLTLRHNADGSLAGTLERGVNDEWSTASTSVWTRVEGGESSDD